MIEIMYDISPGSTYKFSTAFIGEQVRHTLRAGASPPGADLVSF